MDRTRVEDDVECRRAGSSGSLRVVLPLSHGDLTEMLLVAITDISDYVGAADAAASATR